MPDFRVPVGRGFEKTGWFVHRSDELYFAAVDFETLRDAAAEEIIHWENVLRQYLNFYAEQLFKTMKGKMDLEEVGKVVITAWEMRFRPVFVFKPKQHPRNFKRMEVRSFVAGVGQVRAKSSDELMPFS